MSNNQLKKLNKVQTISRLCVKIGLLSCFLLIFVYAFYLYSTVSHASRLRTITRATDEAFYKRSEVESILISMINSITPKELESLGLSEASLKHFISASPLGFSHTKSHEL